MAGMFAVIAVWVALVERGGDHAVNEVQSISRPMTNADQPETVSADPPISDYR
jgi:hypothetical protein